MNELIKIFKDSIERQCKDSGKPFDLRLLGHPYVKEKFESFAQRVQYEADVLADELINYTLDEEDYDYDDYDVLFGEEF